MPVDAVSVAPTSAVPEMDGGAVAVGAVGAGGGGGGGGEDGVVVVVVVVVGVVGVGVVVDVVVVVLVVLVVVVPVVLVVVVVLVEVAAVVVVSVVVVEHPGMPECLHGGLLLRPSAAPVATPPSVTITRAIAAAALVCFPIGV